MFDLAAKYYRQVATDALSQAEHMRAFHPEGTRYKRLLMLANMVRYGETKRVHY